MSDTSPLAHLDPASTRAYLKSIAATLHAVQQPDYPGNANARLTDCILVLSRLAHDLGPASQDAETALAALTNATSNRLSQERSLRDLLQGEAKDMDRAVDALAHTPRRAFEAERFERYLQNHPKGAKTLRVLEAKLLQGGRSKQTMLVRVENQGPHLPSELVIRQDWGKGVPNVPVVFEYYVVDALQSLGLKTAKTLFLEPSAEAMGAPFMVVSRMTGQQKGNLFTPPKSERMALQLAGQLGRLHSQSADAFASIPDLKTLAYTSAQLHAELKDYRAMCDALGQPNETIAAVFAWLEANIEKVSGPKVLLHGDLGFHNYLIEGDDLAAILDWELAHLGNPGEDLGYCRDDVEQMTAWAKFMEAYHAAGGPRIDPFVLDFYTLWSGLHLYVMLLQARAGVVGGHVHEIEIIYCCVNLTPVLLARMARQLEEAQRRA